MAEFEVERVQIRPPVVLASNRDVPDSFRELFTALEESSADIPPKVQSAMESAQAALGDTVEVEEEDASQCSSWGDQERDWRG